MGYMIQRMFNKYCIWRQLGLEPYNNPNHQRKTLFININCVSVRVLVCIRVRARVCACVRVCV